MYSKHLIILGFNDNNHYCQCGDHKPKDTIKCNDFENPVKLESVNKLLKMFYISPILKPPLITINQSPF